MDANLTTNLISRQERDVSEGEADVSRMHNRPDEHRLAGGGVLTTTEAPPPEPAQNDRLKSEEKRKNNARTI